MSKRRATVESDDENSSVEGTPASKRARTHDSDAEPAPQAKGRRASKGKGKARRKDDSDDSDSGGEEEDEAESDRIFEEENEAEIRAALESKRKAIGGIAEFGIIEAIELHQFMCHQRLTFTFGPQMNFIIGHNGSGKSAVLSGITVALGGKAASTGRGSGLKSFIREGQQAAEVTISLKNQGEEAYKPKEYGKSIIITRRFTKEGSSTWKIKSKDGRVISTKKEELAAICDHMNIQVDNPMNVLTQDAARQFLSASSPGDKYKFFLRGTQLSQLSEEYDTCFANVTATTKVLAQKKEAIPDLRTAFKEASTRFEEASKAREQKKKVDELKKELAWAHVNAKKEEMEQKLKDVASQGRRIPKMEDSLKTAKLNLEAAVTAIGDLENEYEAIGDRTDLQDRKKVLQEQIRSKKAELAELNSQIKSIDSQIKAANQSIKELETSIEREMQRSNTDAKREAFQRQLTEVRAAGTAAEEALVQIREQKTQIDEELRQFKQTGIGFEQQLKELQNQILQCQNAIESCRKADTDRYAAYGNNIKQVVERINQTKWYGEKPLGPLGLNVTLKDDRYGDLLRSMLGQLLVSFAVTDSRDIPTLKKILVDYKNERTVIHKFQPDLFDYRQGEPADGVDTVLRVLKIDDPHVLRIMINKNSIESRILAEKRVQAARILERQGAGVAWTLDMFNVTRYPDGGESSVPLNLQNNAHPMLLAGNATDQIPRWTEQKQETERKLQDVKAKFKEAQNQWGAARKRLEDLSARERKEDEERLKSRQMVNQLQGEINAEMPVQISALETTLADEKAAKDLLIAQFTEISQQKVDIDGQSKRLVQERDQLTEELSSFTRLKDEAKEKVADASENRTKLLGEIAHWEGKIAEEKAKVDAAQQTADLVVQEFEDWTAKAAEYCERVETRRSVETIQRNLTSTQAALLEREKRQGASVEEMTVEVNKAKERLDKATHDLAQMTSLNKALKDSLIVRLARWQEFRRHIALRCKLLFGYNLSQRGYYGKVLFDHDKQTLQLKVQTDDQAATQGSRDKDPRSLSGGEKSFSTICLLLSLWESIGCPIRCLDEFDVFMDAVNRRISMKMMIDTANSSDKKQYILITPQDMNNINPGPTVRVQRMSDPERGQGILQFAS